MPAERLQKIIAAAGITSRRKAEELIVSGRVTVNGQLITELGSKADPDTDDIRVDGKHLHRSERKLYIVLHKPKGYVTTVSDPEGRRTIMDLLHGVGVRVYPVGRLDYNSEGLLLLTNDGNLAATLMHASAHVPKTYWVKVSGKLAADALDKLRRGMLLPAFVAPLYGRPGSSTRVRQGRRSEAVKTAPAKIRLLRDAPNPWYEVTLFEGRSRQIRRMFEAVGHHVEKIKRVRYGSLELDLDPGEFRTLTPAELAALRRIKPGDRKPPAR